MNRKIYSELILLIIVGCFVGFFVFPMIHGIVISFTDWNGIGLEWNFIGLNNYLSLFSDKRFANAMSVTILYSMILLFICITFGYMTAKTLYKLKKIKSFAFFISFFPYVITPVVVCILWNQLYINLFPQIGKIINSVTLSHNLLANSNTAIYAVAFVDLWMLIPYSTMLFLSALNSIPIELLEYAELEGASSYKKFILYEFSSILPTIGLLVTIIFSYSFTNLDTIMTLTSGGPGRSTETIYYLIYKNSTLEQRYAYGLAEGILISLISICVFLCMKKIIVGRKVTLENDCN